MIFSELHWVDGPWPGKLAVATCPRGGKWLSEEFARWRREGVDTVLSLLTPQDQQVLDLRYEAIEAEANGMEFWSFPIPDHDVPHSDVQLARVLESLDKELASGTNVAVHCFAGIGRSGLVAACLLVTKGLDSKTAMSQVSDARGISVPETPEQRLWVDRFATNFANLK
jgi:protein-tyrosine phosphatase